MNSEEIVKLAYKNTNQIKAYIYSICRDWAMVDDVMQETLVSLMQNCHSYDESREFLSWALTIARRRTVDILRKEGRSKLIFTDEIYENLESDFCYMEEESQQSINIKYLKECLASLSFENQKIMEMKYFQKMKVDTISKKLGRSFLSIQSLLDRLRQKLKKCISLKLKDA